MDDVDSASDRRTGVRRATLQQCGNPCVVRAKDDFLQSFVCADCVEEPQPLLLITRPTRAFDNQRLLLDLTSMS